MMYQKCSINIMSRLKCLLSDVVLGCITIYGSTHINNKTLSMILLNPLRRLDVWAVLLHCLANPIRRGVFRQDSSNLNLLHICCSDGIKYNQIRKENP